MDDYVLIIDLLKDIFGKARKHSKTKGQMAFCCPVCSYEIKELEVLDGKYNLEVNYHKNVFKCWSCFETHETSGALYKLVKTFGSKQHLKQLELIIPEEFIPQEVKYSPVQLPKEYILFDEVPEYLKLTHYFKQANIYLKNRGITEMHIQKYKIGFCYEGFYAGRIIIPSFDKDRKLNYFIGRSYVGDKLKYRNPEVAKEDVIINEHLIDWTKDLYICEGMFDHIFLNNAVCLLGKYMSDKIWMRIYNEAKGNIFIVLDGDALKDAERLYYKLNGGKLRGKIKLVKLPKNKDIADLRGEIKEEYIEQLEYE